MLCSPLLRPHQLQLNYRKTITEYCLSLAEQKWYNYKHTEKAISMLVGGAETWNGLVSHPAVTIKNQEGYFGCGGTS